MEHTASPTAHIRIANTFFLMEITSTFVRVFIISIAEICEQIYIISACRRCCSLWQTAAPILAVPRCMGRSDGKRNVLSQCQTPCSPFPGLRRSAGRSPGSICQFLTGFLFWFRHSWPSIFACKHGKRAVDYSAAPQGL